MIIYYTDGSASPNPGPGGYAVIKNGQPHLIGSEDGQTTNIRMEAKALLGALADSGGLECQIHTDSEFWINVLTKWAPNWEKNEWTKKTGEIKNLDLVHLLFALYKQSNAELIWVKGHDDVELNELADEWANRARKENLGNSIRFIKGENK